MKSVIISGASGFIGRNLINYYKNKKLNLICLSSKKNNKKQKNIKWIKLDKNYHFLKNKKYNFDTIFISTGIGTVGKSNINKEKIREKKIFNNLLSFIKRNNQKCKIVFFSSYSVYGDVKKKSKENDKFKPLSSYAKNKINFEKKLQKLKNFEVIIFRLTSLYGPYLKKQLIWDTLQKVKQKKRMEFNGSGNELRDFIYIDDAIKAFDLLLRKKNKTNYEIFNCGTGKSITVKKIVNLILKLKKSKKKPYFNGKSEKYIPNKLMVNINKLRNEKWHPSNNINSGLIKYLKWHKKLKT